MIILHCLLVITIGAWIGTIFYRTGYRYVVQDEPDDYFYQSYIVALLGGLVSIGSLYTAVSNENSNFIMLIVSCVFGSILFLFFHSFTDLKQ